MLSKKSQGKCFIDKKVCNKQCVLYRTGLRYFDGQNKPPEPFEECAINIIADGVENMISRTIGLQSEQNKATNAISALSAVLQFAMENSIKNNKQLITEDRQ